MQGQREVRVSSWRDFAAGQSVQHRCVFKDDSIEFTHIGPKKGPAGTTVKPPKLKTEKRAT